MNKLDKIEPMNAQHVREALESLYANVELANTPLAQSGRFVEPDAGVVQRAQALRSLLLDAIEALRPVRSLLPHQAASGRSYEVLSLRYVSSLTVDEIADRLAVGSRQIYRDLRRAEEELAALLDTKQTPAYAGPYDDKQHHSPATAFQAELGTLTLHQDVVELGELLQSAVTMVQALADQKRVSLHYQRPPQPVAITATPSIAKEMLIQLLSALIQQSAYGQLLVVRTRQQRQHAEVRISGDGEGFAWENPLLQNALLMAQLLEMTSVAHPSETQNHEVIIRFNALPASVDSQPILIVEDNPGVSELYQRYLQGTPWRPTLLADPADTFAKVQELRPSAIILDVLMPGMDGWSVLQALRATPEVAHIPVIICSVINDPELATALGAAISLKKPLSRLELVEALQQVT
ncbi:MAG: response regulator [Caldilineaceae bacterium]|nr:response regulator [Caldilineaceae bacterium]